MWCKRKGRQCDVSVKGVSVMEAYRASGWCECKGRQCEVGWCERKGCQCDVSGKGVSVI